MSGIDVPVTGVSIDRLDDYLRSDRSPPECMAMSDLDGFLTALAIGPAVVMPSEWLPIVWGGEQPTFADEEETRAIMGGIFSRYNEILAQVRNDDYKPILWTDTDGLPIATDWAEGFLQAVYLRKNAWEPLFKAKRHSLLLFPILALCGNENGDSVFGFNVETENEIMDEAPTILPASVMGIAEFWRERKPRRTGTLRTERVKSAARLGPRPGRNEPCPCGSGKKFKKCCGKPP